jgi:hypothetical protein
MDVAAAAGAVVANKKWSAFLSRSGEGFNQRAKLAAPELL